jgi:hypothetical protein
MLPVVRGGGAVPLRAIAETIVGERMGEQIRSALDARKQVTFQGAENGAGFENLGAEVSVRLKHFTLKVPERLRGQAQLLDDGVVLRFDGPHSLKACKQFFCIKIERIELTRRRIFIDLEGDSLDQCFELE